MADRDRRTRHQDSPRRRKKESPPKSMVSEEQPRTRAAPYEPTTKLSSSYSSSSSSSYIDISRTDPPYRSRGLGAIRAFFTAPSEHRRRPRRRKSARFLRLGNYSSSSVNSDLAYGTGFIRRRKSTAKLRGKRREKEREYGSGSGRDPRASADPNVAILEVGAGLAALARKQNRLDQLEARKAGIYPVKREDSGRVKGLESSRGLGSSKVSHGPDEDGWESDSESISGASSVDSKLAYGHDNAQGWFGSGRPARKSSVVDPRLFGPANSLHGVIQQPVGFGDVDYDNLSDFPPPTVASPRRQESVMSNIGPLQQVYPIPTSDPTQFEGLPGSVSSTKEQYTSRQGSVPLIQPQPITPVSQSLYDQSYTARSDPKPVSSSGRSKSSVAGAALAGVAGAAIVNSIVSDRREERKDSSKQREEKRDSYEKSGSGRYKDDDRERRDDRNEVKDDRRDPRERRDRDRAETGESREQRRERRQIEREDYRRNDPTGDGMRRDEVRDAGDDDRRRRRKRRDDEVPEAIRDPRNDEEYNGRRDDRYDETRSRKDNVTVGIDPFQFQVADDAFKTPDGTRNADPLTSIPSIQRARSPAVVTVQRVPHWERAAPAKDEPSESLKESKEKEQASRERRRTEREAESMYQETEHFTAPIEMGAVGVAVAIVTAEGHRQSRSEKIKKRRYEDKRDGSTGERDRIQEEADRIYREAVLARDIASRHNDDPVIRVVTPPEMIHKKKESPYDAPNADFQLDHIMDPVEFRISPVKGPGEYPTDRSFDRAGSDPGPSLEGLKRPLLNLVRPTPTPSPAPIDRKPRSERKDSSRDVESSEPKKTKEEPRKAKEEAQTAREIDTAVTRPNGESSEVSPSVAARKGVTWGENETKYDDVETPSETRDDPIAARGEARDSQSKPKMTAAKKASAWGAIRGAFMSGAAADAVIKARESSDSGKHDSVSTRDVPSKRDEVSTRDGLSKRDDVSARDAPSKGDEVSRREVSSKRDDVSRSGNVSKSDESSKKDKRDRASKRDDLSKRDDVSKYDRSSDRERDSPSQSKPFEYRGVVVEPERRDDGVRERSPPAVGPKPSNLPSSQMPGAFEDDVDFTATLVEGLEKSGFNPDIVAKDPTYRRRNSPPGSQVPPSGDYRQPFAETVSDLGQYASEASVIGKSREVEVDDIDSPTKLTKKEQRKLEKAAKRQSSEVRDNDLPDDSPITSQLVEEPESFIESSKSDKKEKKRDKSKKSKKDSYDEPDDRSSKSSGKVSVPIDAFDDLRQELASTSRDILEDEYTTSKKKKKSKRDSDVFDSPARSMSVSEVGSSFEPTSTKKSKDKSSRRSVQFDSEPNPEDVPLPSASEVSRDDYEETRKPKKSSKRSSSVPDVDARSVKSEKYDDENDSKITKKEKKNGGFFGMFGSSTTKSEPERPKDTEESADSKKKSKKSKRSSTGDSSEIYGSDKLSSIGNGYDKYDDDDGDTKRSVNGESKRGKSDQKDDSFLDNAGTLGAGVGIAAAIALAAKHQQSKAAKADVEERASRRSSLKHISPAQQGPGETSRDVVEEDIIDPEISQRQIRPSIDPQYGDLLPLPPSDPGSPNVEPGSVLPLLPESRPNTPPQLESTPARDRSAAQSRRSDHAPLVKTPSNSAVPLKFVMGNRSTPASPSVARPSPVASPSTMSPDGLGFPKARPRPTSWESTKEIKPLLLLNPDRMAPGGQIGYPERQSLDRDPTKTASVISTETDLDVMEQPLAPAIRDFGQESQPEIPVVLSRGALGPKEPPEIVTQDLSSLPALPDSGTSTPLDTDRNMDLSNLPSLPLSRTSTPAQESDLSKLPPLPRSRSTTPVRVKPHHGSNQLATGLLAGAALSVTAGALVATSGKGEVEKASEVSAKTPPQEDLPQEFEVEPITKDRSSYLFQATPPAKRYRDNEAEVPLEAHEDELEVGIAKSSEAVLGKDFTGEPVESPAEDIVLEREAALEALTRSVPAEDESPVVISSQPATAPESEAEGAGEFFTKSARKKKGDKKSDKKKDKKKGSKVETTPEPSSIFDSPQTVPEGGRKPDVVDEFFTKGSKRSKKKDKQRELDRQDVQEIQIPAPVLAPAILEAVQKPDDEVDIPGEPSTISGSRDVDNAPAEDDILPEFLLKKTKKGRKNDKKKAAFLTGPEEEDNSNVILAPSIVASNVEPETLERSLEPSSEATTTSFVEPEAKPESAVVVEPVEGYTIQKPKEGKMDKKITLPFDPKEETSANLVLEPNVETTIREIDLADEYSAAPPEALTAPPVEELERLTEPETWEGFPINMSKKVKKKDKKKAMDLGTTTEVSSSSLLAITVEASASDIALTENLPSSADIIPRPAVKPDTPRDVEPHPTDDSSLKKLKKEKRKDRKKAVDPDHTFDAPLSQVLAPSVLTDENEAAVVDQAGPISTDTMVPLPEEAEPAPELETWEEFPIKKTKKEQKKDKTKNKKEALDTGDISEKPLSAPVLPSLAGAAAVAALAFEASDDYSSAISKKDKKKDKNKKSLSRSSTFDAPAEPANPLDGETGDVSRAEQIPLPLSRTRSEADFIPENDDVEAQTREIITGEHDQPAEPVAEVSSGKKSKKSQKKGHRSSPARGPEEPYLPDLSVEEALAAEQPVESGPDALDSRFKDAETVREAPKIEPVADFTPAKESKRDKKKRGKSIGGLELEKASMFGPVVEAVPEEPVQEQLETESKQDELFERELVAVPSHERETSITDTETKDMADAENTGEAQQAESPYELDVKEFKKSKKKKGKSSSARPEDEPSASQSAKEIVSEPVTEPASERDDFSGFSTPTTKGKGKKQKKRQSIAWDIPEPEVEASRQADKVSLNPIKTVDDAALDQIQSQRRMEELHRDVSGEPEFVTSEDEIKEHIKDDLNDNPEDNVLRREPANVTKELDDSAEPSDSKKLSVTPDSEPFATGRTDFSDAEYFPSAMALHSPRTPKEFGEPVEKGYFPSAVGMLPVAAPVPARDAKDEDLSMPGDHAQEVSGSPRSPLTVASAHPELVTTEEFSKQANVDHSLSAMEVHEDVDGKGYLPSTSTLLPLAVATAAAAATGIRGLERAASPEKISTYITPKPSSGLGPNEQDSRAESANQIVEKENIEDADRAVTDDQPVDQDEATTYSEEQAARQLSAELGSGKRKPKKSKKNRADLWQASTQDDDTPFDVLNQQVDTVTPGQETGNPEAEANTESQNPDGFAAGYEPEQLSLAKQLQAEFDMAKKPKKGKKSRSTSRTPKEFESDSPFSEERHLDDAQPSVEGDRDLIADGEDGQGKQKPDGLAAGYSPDQLELAQQTQEEFGLSSKNSKTAKKDKNNRKRQSLARSSTDGNLPPSTHDMGSEEASIATSEVDSATGSPYPLSRVTTQDDVEGFSFTPKKTKKGGKKRESLLRSTTQDGEASAESTRGSSREPDSKLLESSERETPISNAPAQDIDDASSPTVADDGEAFSFKIKKDKKGRKKRDSLLRSSTQEEVPPSEPMPKSVELGSTQTDITKPDKFSKPDTPIDRDMADLGAELNFNLKKSKTGKGGKDIAEKSTEGGAVSSEAEKVFAEEPGHSKGSLADRIWADTMPDEAVPQDSENPSAESEDPLGFYTTKQTKKSKKRDKPKSTLASDPEPSPLNRDLDLVSAPLENSGKQQLSWADEMEEGVRKPSSGDWQDQDVDNVNKVGIQASGDAILDSPPPTTKDKHGVTNAISTGIAAVGAALLASAATSHDKEPADDESAGGSAERSATADKKSISSKASESKKNRKGKGRSKILERRVAEEPDLFDDPMLWEGAEQQKFGDHVVETDTGDNDGFWSAPAEQEDVAVDEAPEMARSADDPLAEPLIVEMPQKRERSASLMEVWEPSTALENVKTSRMHEHEDIPMAIARDAILEEGLKEDFVGTYTTERNISKEDSLEASSSKRDISDKESRQVEESGSMPQWNDLPEDLLIKPSQKAAKKNKKQPLAAWKAPDPVEESKAFEPDFAPASEPPSTRNIEPAERIDINTPVIATISDVHDRGVESQPIAPFMHEEQQAREADNYEIAREPKREDHEETVKDKRRRQEIYVSPGSNLPVVEEEGEYQEPEKRSQPREGENSKARHRRDEMYIPPPSTLPVVMEEERPDQIEAEREISKPQAISHDRSIDDFNRDSAFVTDSPIPPFQRKFADESESARDSGVHLREWGDSPARKEKSPMVNADDLLTRLSWPPVDEETETVNLKRSQRQKPERSPKTSTAKAAIAAIAGATSIGAAEVVSQATRTPPRNKDEAVDAAKIGRSVSPNISRLQTPDHAKYRPGSVGSNRSSVRSSGTPPLRRSDRKLSGDLRSLSQRSQPNLAKEAKEAAKEAEQRSPATSIVNINPIANEGRVRVKDMADVYDGFGEGRIGSPMSPTRPHSMRRRQSMQVLDLEARVDQLAAENRMLAEAKEHAEYSLQSSQKAVLALADREAEVDNLKQKLDWLHREVERLKEVNDGLTSASVTLGRQHNERYDTLESQHAQATRELEDMKQTHGNLSAGMEGSIQDQVRAASEAKDAEIAQLRQDLGAAQERIGEMQRELLTSRTSDSEFLVSRDEDYFDNACQQLCQHVQQWVLRFSKFSDMRACRLTSEINNDKIIDRLDNAVLDGSDVDEYLSDRVKRRDIFMSMTMTMIWEFVFTRYLFGMDREQRQKLKSLEKTLLEVGPPAAVHQWRATTLTLLSKRAAFQQQREQDTEAVVQMIFQTLSEILPPPTHLEEQIQSQLQRVMKSAVDLSVEMRTQRAEYMMLPPLQPEYDANGDLARQVQFNAALMNERSGDTVSNEELEGQQAVVRIVLFPLVVKKGDDAGGGDDEIVVCPAQVLVAKPRAHQSRLFSPTGLGNQSRISMQSGMPDQVPDI